MTTFAEQIKGAREALSLSQPEAAMAAQRELRRITGDDTATISLSAYQKYEQGQNEPSTSKADAIKIALGLRQNNGRATRAVGEERAPYGRAGQVAVPLASVRASGGEGEEFFQEEIAGFIQYNGAALRRELGVDPRRLLILPAAGNSMLSTISPGDRLWVLRYEGGPIIDGVVYVWHRRDHGVMVKRAFWQEDGSLLLKGDNPKEPTRITIRPGDEGDWRVIGRVVRVEKNL